jgi:aminopeptidase N
MTIKQSRQGSLSRPLIFFITLLVFQIDPSPAADRNDYRDLIDVQKYCINIGISDTTDAIKGITGLKFFLKRQADTIILDLASLNNEKKGMVVDSILHDGSQINFLHSGNQLRLSLPDTNVSDTINITAYYTGIPADGLIISENMYGKRTFFADNWPNRANHWFPSIDHPSDRAKVDFTITAPSHYQVIATGLLQKKVSMPGKKTTHYWSSEVPIPTKVMVFGAAEFAVEYLDDINGIPWSNWVYPPNMEEGFSAFSATPGIMDFFTEMIGPYPFEKIANVQSTTRYGGMENAGNIFYHEKAVAGDHSIIYTIVHEIAHQWFGNALSESDWPHLWLSEGIATWLTDWYAEQTHGPAILRERMADNRRRVIEYSRKRLVPVVDYHTENYTDLLNPNSYQKGSWILHMLRRKIGEETLVGALAGFYNRHRFSHASSDDFIRAIEDSSGMDLDLFFDDWLFSAGHPVLTLNTNYSQERIYMELIQTQQHKMAFTFPLDIRFVFDDGTYQDETFNIMFRRHEFILDLPSKPIEIILDPDTWLLFEKNQS